MRLGYCWGTKPHIRKQPFFSPIDWNKLEKREIKPPFRPEVVSVLFALVRFFIIQLYIIGENYMVFVTKKSSVTNRLYSYGTLNTAFSNKRSDGVISYMIAGLL